MRKNRATGKKCYAKKGQIIKTYTRPKICWLGNFTYRKHNMRVCVNTKMRMYNMKGEVNQ